MQSKIINLIKYILRHSYIWIGCIVLACLLIFTSPKKTLVQLMHEERQQKEQLYQEFLERRDAKHNN
jgi:hypothetical protein